MVRCDVEGIFFLIVSVKHFARNKWNNVKYLRFFKLKNTIYVIASIKFIIIQQIMCMVLNMVL